MPSFFYSRLDALLATRQAVMAGLRQPASRRDWIGHGRHILHRDCLCGRGIDDLTRPVGGCDNPGSQRFVPGHHLGERILQRQLVQCPRRSVGEDQVRGRIAGSQLIEKPEALLRERRRLPFGRRPGVTSTNPGIITASRVRKVVKGSRSQETRRRTPPLS